MHNWLATVIRNYFLQDSLPARLRLLRKLDKRFNLLSYKNKLYYATLDRPPYGHCLLHAALLARKLGHSAMSAIEFGVAGGNGLIALEKHAAKVTGETGVAIMIYGFDTGHGMPPPRDYRDLPYLWTAGYFAMDVSKLKSSLKTSRLILGDVADTVRNFPGTERPPPIGFIVFDLDYYSSTVEAMKIFDTDYKYLLPRVVCYVDDMVGDLDWAYNEFTG